MKYVLMCLFLLSGQLLHAQTCTGGLGDPIVNITFGAGPNFGSPLAAGVTNLQYQSNECPNDGQYTIASSTNNCFGSTWVNLNGDHTGNPNGYFMLINASYEPSDFYVQTVSGLCEGTTFQFAAWILNLAANPGQILPNITFSIQKTDGTPLASFNTGNIAQANPPKWNQYGFYFTTPPGVSTVVLRMTNNAPGGIGNDLALDDITFRATGPALTIMANGQPRDTVIICEGSTSPVQLTSSIENCYSTAVYQWQQSTDTGKTWTPIPGATNQTYTALPVIPGAYLYRLSVAQSGNAGIASCNVASPPITIDVLKIPIPALSITAAATGICQGASATFTALPTDGGNSPQYQWMINGIPASTGGATYTTNTLANADIVSCVMTSDAACVIDPIAVSNDIPMTVTPDVLPTLQVTASATTICSDSLVTFTALPGNGGSHPDYQWMINGAAAGTDTAVFSTSSLQDGDNVSVLLNGSLYCSLPVTSIPIMMTVYPLPVILLPPDTIIAGGTSIHLDPVITGQVVSWQWSPASWLDNPAIPDPLASPIATTAYSLLVTTDKGCYAMAKETVAVFYDLLMPNAFTPNGDGKNDVFRIPPIVPVKIIRFVVYDRWGELMFSTADSGAGWDGRLAGKPQPAGTYVWMIEYNDPLIKRSVMKHGTVILVR